MRTNKLWPIAAVTMTISGGAMALEEHVGMNAEKGDPQRWYVPADTPRLRYDAQLKEARAALAEAMKSCAGQAQERKSCEAEARSQFQADAAHARAMLADEMPR
jgi:hypothetical protein